MTVAMPDAAAFLAAASLVAMPPVPSGPPTPAIASIAGRHRGHDRHECGVAVRARVGGVETVDVAQDHQQVGFEQDRGQRREVVVVAELDLLDDDGVVLVHDRNHPPLEQRHDGVLARSDSAAGSRDRRA